MTFIPATPAVPPDLEPSWADDVVDLTDRRRLLLLTVFGVDVSPELVAGVFEPAAHRGDQASPSASGSTTMRSDGRPSSTVDR